MNTCRICKEGENYDSARQILRHGLEQESSQSICLNGSPGGHLQFFDKQIKLGMMA